MKMVTVQKQLFGITRSGEQVLRTVLTNSQGVEVALINYGATIQSIRTPDRNGHLSNIVLSCDSIENYENQDVYLGAVAGRTANRTAKGRAVIHNTEYHLNCNDDCNHLHGGDCGFNRKVWQQTVSQNVNSASVIMSYLSPDGEEGYPGNLKACVTYTLTKYNQLEVVFSATTDQATLVNLTQHSYFNLAGSDSCHEHILQLNADHYLPIDSYSIPTGEVAEVVETPFDFRQPKAIGRDIGKDHHQLTTAAGYDHCFCLAEKQSTVEEFARVLDQSSGRVMTVATDQPGVQFYTGNFLNGTPATDGQRYQSRQGFCLETQAWPDAPNQPDFPSTELKQGDTYSHQTVFTFSCEEGGL